MLASTPPTTPALLFVLLALGAAGCARDAATARETPRAAASAAAAPSRAEQTATIRYLALGDSFTIGTGSRPVDAFPARLAERWRAAGRAVELKNVAVNGFTTQDLLDVELPAVAPFAPTLVTLAVGANDLVRGSTAPRYRAQVRRIFAALAAAGVPAARVVALPQPDWSLAPAAADFGDAREIAGRIEAWNAILRAEAEEAGARYVDLFPRMRAEAKRGAFAADGLHPSAAAHDAWAAEIAARFTP
jgi:lysophospholipase L1-like esterase